MHILRGFFLISAHTHSISLFLKGIKIQGRRKVWITGIRNHGINKRTSLNFTGMKISWEGVLKLA